MPQNILHMYAASTGGTENALANIDIPDDGTIEGVHHNLRASLNADGEFAVSELSFIATSQSTTNDARGILSMVAWQAGLLTSGSAPIGGGSFVPMDIEVSGGERVYLHSVAAGGVTGAHYVDIYFRPRGGVSRRERRRT